MKSLAVFAFVFVLLGSRGASAMEPDAAPVDAGVTSDDNETDDYDAEDMKPPEPKNTTSRLHAIGISLGVIGALVVVRLLMGGRG